MEVNVQQVCAFTALTVRKLRLEGKNPIGIADLEWIFARNCWGTEPLRKVKGLTGWFTDCKNYTGVKKYEHQACKTGN